MTQPNYTAYVLQLQSLLSDWHVDANDLSDGDLGLERGQVVRKPRERQAAGGRKQKAKKRHLQL